MNIKCQCKESDKHGQTSVMCCNHCGLPDEDFWSNGEENSVSNLPDVVYVETEIKKDLPPFNVPIICMSNGECRGEFTFRNEGYARELLYDYGITHWLKKVSLGRKDSELNQTKG